MTAFATSSIGPIVHRVCSSLALAVLMLATTTLAAHTQTRAVQFKLDNGMDVIVIPDRRAPVATHMVWYRVGAADEPRGASGIAHFLEHLMFKGTEQVQGPQFSKIVARNGGIDNAFTSHDVTAYYQNIAKDRLKLMMEMEADRMVNLRMTENDVVTERKVILEERRSRVDASPPAQLDEQMMAALYLNHPYGVPVIGWEHEMAKLSHADAMGFYKRYYAPNNAILVVAGDVEPQEVLALAKETYGKIPANPATLRAPRAEEPPAIVARRIDLVDANAGQPVVMRYYRAPATTKAAPREAEALDLLIKVMMSGATSRAYRQLVVEQGLASSVYGYYSSDALDYGRIAVYGVANEGVSLDAVMAGIQSVFTEVRNNGITQAELDRARNAYIADYIYESDNQSNLARRYGWGVATGQTIEQIEEWPRRLQTVTLADVQQAARNWLVETGSVTGYLKPSDEPTTEAAIVAPRP